MIHPHTELRYKNDVVGYAVYATRPIPAGTVVWTLCSLDQRISADRREELTQETRELVDYFGYVDGGGDTILCWDHGRYVNHSCRPSMMAVGQEHEIAVRDLAPGDELTCDYGNLNLVEPLDCFCGASECRGTINRDELATTDLAARTDDHVRSVMRIAGEVTQPLAPFMADPERFAAQCDGRVELPSVMLCDASSFATR